MRHADRNQHAARGGSVPGWAGTVAEVGPLWVTCSLSGEVGDGGSGKCKSP